MNSDLKNKILSHAQLMRLPNIFTAIADVIAGYLIVLGTNVRWPDLIGLSLSTAAIYAGGCVLNDLCDREVDARERPFRPIPSGKVSIKEAYFLTCILFTIRLIAALGANFSSFFTALILILLVIAYDTGTKNIAILGALNMGACRAFNLVLGMSPGLHFEASFLIPPLISLIYVSSITALSKFEVYGGMGSKGKIVLSGWVVVILSIIGLKLQAELKSVMFIYLAVFILYTGPALLRSLRSRQAESIGLAVKTLVLAIPLLDAVYCSGFQGFLYGIPVILCLVPSLLLARYLYVT